MEVNLAILLVALGMLALFGLFPAGLREADMAITDTHTALFADYVLSGIQANAATNNDWNTWRDITKFRVQAVSNLKADNSTPIVSSSPSVVSSVIPFAGSSLRYVLEIGGVDYRSPGIPHVRTVALWVWSGTRSTSNVGQFKPLADLFCTEVYFPGALP